MKKELIAHKDPKSPVSEVFRTLRTNIQFMSTSNKLNTLLVTSTFPGEGKSWVTSNLAVTFAQAGKQVILVDADMRKGRQYNIFGVLPRPGLSNYLSSIGADNMQTSDTNIAKYIQETDVENLHIMTSGNVPPNPSELLISTKMAELIEELKKMCDIVIIDGTPCDLVTDSVILSRIVDSTVIVTAHKETKKDNLERIVKNIQNVGGKIAGIVVNKIPIPAKKYSESYYYGSIPSDGKKKDLNNKRRERIRNTEQDYSDDYDTEKETEKSVKEDYNNLKNIEIEASNDISIDKANEILKQINKYIDTEKLNLNKENK